MYPVFIVSLLLRLLLVFLFKQKTAYALRISDLISDVCSSDLRSRPSLSMIAISPARDSDTRRPRPSTIVGMLRYSSVPSTGASSVDCSDTCAAPPMWTVRIVSCVLGSPLDWAAITPTDSHMFTGVTSARSRPYQAAHTHVLHMRIYRLPIVTTAQLAPSPRPQAPSYDRVPT